MGNCNSYHIAFKLRKAILNPKGNKHSSSKLFMLEQLTMVDVKKIFKSDVCQFNQKIVASKKFWKWFPLHLYPILWHTSFKKIFKSSLKLARQNRTCFQS